jgi:VanZ family protein
MSVLATRVPMAARMVWFVALFGVVALSLTPVDRLPPQVFDVWDKAQHAFGFAVLAVLGVLAYPGRMGRLVLGLLVLGALIEVAQSMSGWRYGDVADWVADALGVAAGAPVGRYAHAVRQRWARSALQR